MHSSKLIQVAIAVCTCSIRLPMIPSCTSNLVEVPDTESPRRIHHETKIIVLAHMLRLLLAAEYPRKSQVMACVNLVAPLCVQNQCGEYLFNAVDDAHRVPQNGPCRAAGQPPCGRQPLHESVLQNDKWLPKCLSQVWVPEIMQWHGGMVVTCYEPNSIQTFDMQLSVESLRICSIFEAADKVHTVVEEVLPEFGPRPQPNVRARQKKYHVPSGL
mmetsp:Transcript_117788/g.375514  ORF Transcript_117788/g.375514 Transcript_117788/m.375514 type:complete len:215 (+) Transcript_117788:730-1374(+)